MQERLQGVERNQRKGLKCALRVLVTGGITFLLVLILLWPSKELIFKGKNDFLSFYAGGELVLRGDIYDAEAVRDIQLDVANAESNTLPFIRLPYFALVCHPLTWLPYRQSYCLWQVANFLALVGFIVLTPSTRKCNVVVAVSCSVPLLVSFANGQDLPMVLLFWSLSSRLLDKRRDFAAGLCLALCIAKAHLFVFVPIAVLGARRWRFLGGSSTGILALLGISCLAAGPDWPAKYGRLLSGSDLHASSLVYPNAAGILKSLSASPYWLFPLGAVAALVVLSLARKVSFSQSLGTALLAGVLMAPHCFLQDLSLLVPVFLKMFETATREFTKLTSFLLLTPLLYLMELALPAPLASLLPVSLGLLFWRSVFDSHDGAE
jgi:hypothetical protein